MALLRGSLESILEDMRDVILQEVSDFLKKNLPSYIDNLIRTSLERQIKEAGIQGQGVSKEELEEILGKVNEVARAISENIEEQKKQMALMKKEIEAIRSKPEAPDLSELKGKIEEIERKLSSEDKKIDMLSRVLNAHLSSHGDHHD